MTEIHLKDHCNTIVYCSKKKDPAAVEQAYRQHLGLLPVLLCLIMACTVSCTKPEPTIPEAVVTFGPLLKSSETTLISNGGGNGTTDWNKAGKSQPPDSWLINQYGRCEVRRDVHYSGSYLRCFSRSQFTLTSPPAPDDGKAWHTVTFYYRSDTEVRLAVKYSPTCTYCVCVLPVASKVQYVTVRFWSPMVLFIRFYNSPIRPGFMELDEVNLF
jgi:hypothetical protein